MADNAWDQLKRALRQIDPLNTDGAWQLITSGTVNIVGGGSGGTSSVDNNPFTPGGTSITPVGGYQGGRQIASGNAGAFAISPSGLLLVDVRAGGAGGGQANLTVRGTANSDIQVGYASGAGPNVPGGAYVPILGTVNLGAGAAPFASVAVYGSPANPIYNVGSVNVVNPVGIFGSVNVLGTVTLAAGAAPFASVAVYGSPANPVYVVGSVGVTPLATYTVALDKIPTVNLGLGTVNVGNNVGIFGSVNVLGSVSIGGVAVVDTRASLVPTQWLISFGGSGASQVAAAAPANQRIWLSSFHLTSTGTLDLMWQSPSGVAVSGSMRILPGAGFGLAGVMPNGPVVFGSLNSPLFLNGTGTQNVGGVALGWVA